MRDFGIKSLPTYSPNKTSQSLSLNSAKPRATTRPSTDVNTPVGAFHYQWLPLHLYSVAILREANDGFVFLIAHPLKALLDLVYTRKKSYTSLQEIEADLRLDTNELARLLATDKNRDIAKLKQVHKRDYVSKVIDMVLWELR